MRRAVCLLFCLASLPLRAAPRAVDLRVPPADAIPAVEPPPTGETPPLPNGKPVPPVPGAPKAAAEKKQRVQVTVFPLSHPGVPESTAVPILRSLSETLRHNARLDMKDLDTRLSDFAGDVPGDQIDLARGAYQKGREAMQRLELDAAIPQLQDAVDQLIEVLPYIKKQELADAMLALAVAQLEKGSRRACNAALIRLLTWRNDYQFDAEQFPPDIKEPLEEARRAVSKLAHGQAHITSEPDGAQVFVDGTYQGVTPLDAGDLLVGEHFLTFKKIGYRKGLRVVTVGSRTPANAMARLVRSEKFLLVQQALERVEKEMGGPRLDPVVDNLKETMYLDHGVFLRLVPGRVILFLYDLRSRRLLKEITATLSPTDDMDLKLGQLGETLYGGVDYEGAPMLADEPLPPPPVVRTPLYKKWWFLTAAGAILAGSAAAVGIGVALTRTPNCPDGHVCTGPLVY